MSDTHPSDRPQPRLRNSIVVPPQVGTLLTEPAMPFPDDIEPEPMSFAPRRIRFSDAPAGQGDQGGYGGDRIEFEVVTARFRSIDALRRTATARFPREDALALIRATTDEVRARALELPSAQESARMNGLAASLDKLLESPIARSYLGRPEISRELATYLRRYRAVSNGPDGNREVRDIVLKASVTAIHVAPCLGYWRACAIVPDEVKPFLSAENVFGSVFRIAKERRPPWVDRLLARYTTITTDLANRPGKHGPIPIQTRNSILWPWCKFNIKNVTYKLYRSDAALVDAEETLADIKLVLVLFNVLLDDIADCLQDRELLQIFTQIPSAAGRVDLARPEDYTRLRRRLQAMGYPQFEAYFDLAVDCWVESIGRLRQVVGAGFDEHHAQFARDHELLLGAMQFSADVNTSSAEVFAASDETLRSRYGCDSFSDILAHNANRAVFFTIDQMALRAFDPARHEEMASSQACESYRENALVFQDMHQVGNSLATGARETDSDDLSNEIFKIANDRLNQIDDWPLPPHVEALAGASRKDVVLRAFERKKQLKREWNRHPDGSPEREGARAEYVALGGDIERMVEMSGAERYYFEHWWHRREDALDVFYQCGDWIDGSQLVTANDLVLVLHLMYKGRI